MTMAKEFLDDVKEDEAPAPSSSVNSLGVIPNGKLVKKKDKDISPTIKGESVMKQSRAAALLEKQYLMLDEATKFAFNPIMNIGGRLADVVASIEADLGKDALVKYTTDMLIVKSGVDLDKVKAALDKWKVQYTIETAESVLDGQEVQKMPDQVSTQTADPNMVSPNDPDVETPAEAPTVASMVFDALKGAGFTVDPVEGGFMIGKDGASVTFQVPGAAPAPAAPEAPAPDAVQ